MNQADTLYSKIKEEVRKWRDENYFSEFPEIQEILNFQRDNSLQLKFLREPQFEALETYLYLRFVKKSKSIISLYKEFFSNNIELFKSLGINLSQEDLIEILSNGGINNLFETIENNDDFVKKYNLENIRETISLPYPSYIFSLVMGAGKTILIGTIIYVEFALSFATKNDIFLKNALVFAPGKTIIGSLKEISHMPIEKILPARLSKVVETNLKITYTQDNQKNIPIVEGSEYNIIVTNIEKIRIQKRNSQSSLKNLINFKQKLNDEEKSGLVNLRLKQLSSLKSLGVFSDEAHNTYGQELDKEIKRVRETINYLSNQTDLKIVVNTTGTPYFKKNILKDVVFWYGLLEGINDNILKDIRGNIYSYADVKDENFVSEVLEDFFNEYGEVKTTEGHNSKIAFYFPRIENVDKIKPFIQQKIVELGYDINIIFHVNSKSSDKDKDIFINRVNDKNLPYRIFLLVDMGKEGWNCPSLFSCCLARDLGSSNNFVLQASTRCLRQIRDNELPARIYLSQKNTSILEKQLKENYGEELKDFRDSQNNKITKKVTLLKTEDELPQIRVLKKIRKYIKQDVDTKSIIIQKPIIEEVVSKQIRYDFSQINKAEIFELDYKDIIVKNTSYLDVYQASQKISSMYDLDFLIILKELKSLNFKDNILTQDEFNAIKLQIESQLQDLKQVEEEREEMLTIIKKSGFEEEMEVIQLFEIHPKE